MKLIQTYANNASVEIKNPPFLFEKFFPLGNINKYITIQNSSGMPAKNYSFYQEVIDLLFPILEKENIKIILLGDKDATPLNKVLDLRGQTTLHQSIYILKRSLLHFGNDSWLCHAAGALNVNLVALYGSTTVSNHSPYHHNPTKTILLESHRNGQKASFQREENPKMIDLINPEQICSAICKLLHIEWSYPYKTLKIGNSYSNKIIESSMDSVINTQALNIPNIICRLDYNYNLQNLINQTQVSKVSVVTNQPIQIQLLQQIKPSIIEVVYEIKENHNPDFCKILQELKIPYRLYSRLSEEKLNPIKLDYLDYNIITKIDNKIPDIIKNKDINNIYIKGSKFIISQKGIFNSYWSYKNSKSIPNFEAAPQQLVDINLDNLGFDVDYLMFLEKL